MSAFEEISEHSNVPLVIQVELTRTNLRVRDLLRLKPGSVIQSNVAVGEGVGVWIGGISMAKGELTHGQGKLGVRILSLTVDE